MECLECGHELPLGEKKCIYCGEPVEAAHAVAVIEAEGSERKNEQYAHPDESPIVFPRQKMVPKRRLHPLLLFMIFLASASFVGWIMWLMM